MLKTGFTIAPLRRRPGVSPAAALLFSALLAVSAGCGSDSSPSTPAPTPAPPPAPTTPTTPTPPPDPEPAQPDTATYTFEQPETLIGPRADTPVPEGATFHGELALFLHSPDERPFEEGLPASDGLKTLAETGPAGEFLAEAEAAGAVVLARSLGQLLELFLSPDRRSIEVTLEKPCVSYAQHLSPSSDWFVGWTTECALDSEGRWRDSITAEMIAFDAGTAEGPSFQPKTGNTEPRFAVTQLDLRQFPGITEFPAVFQRITANRKTE